MVWSWFCIYNKEGEEMGETKFNEINHTRTKKRKRINDQIFRRKIEKKIRRDTRRKKKRKQSIKTYRSQDFLKFIKKTPFRKKTRLKKNSENEVIIKIPEVFSLIKNPDSCIEVYCKIMNAFYKKDIDGVYFDHIDCHELEIGASTVMDVFVMNLEKHKKNLGKEFALAGRLPIEEKCKTMLIVSGIIKHLEFKEMEQETIESYPGEIRRLDLMSGGKSSSTYKVNHSLTSDIVATKVADYFEECLKTQGLGIKPEGKAYIGQLVGETINNCQLHSGDFSQFYTLGHYFTKDGSGFGECQIVIFNFGQTIYEGLKNNAVDLNTVNDLRKITKLHTEKGLFNFNHWDEEVLWTLYALQDGVSREKSDEDPDRGTGTVKLIESFQNIGATLKGKIAEMSIISGSAHIYFDGKYTIKREKRDNEYRDIIAFNKKNDLEDVPDKNYVKKLKNYFPGTIISLDFYIDRGYIINLQEERKNGN